MGCFPSRTRRPSTRTRAAPRRVLSQEEIDGLLGFSVADVSLNDNSGIRAIIDSAMVSYERLPMLEIVFGPAGPVDDDIRCAIFTSDNVRSLA